MTPVTNIPSARIYQFPTRAELAAARLGETTKPVSGWAPPRATPVVFGSNWYHDVAVQEAASSSEHN